MLVSNVKIGKPALRALVEAFYLDAREDPLLGPVFDRHIEDWEEHLGRMTDFWASLMIRDSSYSGHPLELHRGIPELTRPMFDRWVEIFSAAAERQFGSTTASAILIDHARRMGVQLSRMAVKPAAGEAR